VQTTATIGSAEDRVFQEMLGLYDAPAYVRRALRVQQAYDDLIAKCQRQRGQWLTMVRVRLGTLKELAGRWSAVGPYLADESELHILAQMQQELAPQLLAPVETTSSPRRLRLALTELCASVERFNHRWREFLSELPLDFVNDERAAYNKYYLLEKECAMRSAVLARIGFRPLEPLLIEELAALMPELPVPSMRS
jgi:hypothetical protein